MSLSKNDTDCLVLSDDEDAPLDKNNECFYIIPKIEKIFGILFFQQEDGCTRQQLYNLIYEKNVNPRTGKVIGMASRAQNLLAPPKNSMNESSELEESIVLSDDEETPITNKHEICFYILPELIEYFQPKLSRMTNNLTVQYMYNKIYEAGFNPRNGSPIGNISRRRKMYYKAAFEQTSILPPNRTFETRDAETQTKITLAEAKYLDTLPDHSTELLLKSAQLPEAQLSGALVPSDQLSDTLLPSAQLPEVQLSEASVPSDQLHEPMITDQDQVLEK